MNNLLIENLNCFLIDEFSDENDIIDWNNYKNKKKYFDCGCCDNCLCDDNIKCVNCGCNCNGDEFDDDFDYYSDNDNFDDDFDNEQSSCPILKINIIKNEKISNDLIRITLELNVILDNLVEVINFDFDINHSTYLKIINDLIK
jgi:hypothetical protein